MTTLYADLVSAGRDPDAPVRVRVDRSGDRAVVILDEPERLNVLSAALVLQLKDALAGLAADPEVRSVILTGSGPGFSAGGDLRMMSMAEERITDAEGSTDVWRWIATSSAGSPG